MQLEACPAQLFCLCWGRSPLIMRCNDELWKRRDVSFSHFLASRNSVNRDWARRGGVVSETMNVRVCVPSSLETFVLFPLKVFFVMLEGFHNEPHPSDNERQYFLGSAH